MKYLGLLNMPWMLVIFAMIQPFGSANDIIDAINEGQKNIVKEVADVKSPLLDFIIPILASQCSTLKTLLGLNYKQVSSKEPDVSKLNIVYITKEFKYLYYLPTLAENLPEMPNFNPNANINIFIHGFTDDPSKDNFQLINNAFQSRGIDNILALDASSLIRFLYGFSSSAVRDIGLTLGTALAEFVNGFDPAKIHVIGHSLGAHVAGFAGKTFHKLTGLKLGRVTGLDPAGPCFGELVDDLRLFRTDAEFVDVIHTNAGVYGLNQDVGTADFYVNGGSQQPDCYFETCSHSLANEFFAESVMNPSAYQARSCSNQEEFENGNCKDNEMSYMGFGATPGITGRFYLQTNEVKPFGAYEKGLEYENRDGFIENLGNGVQSLFG